jgi:hypothetical protein
LKINSKIGKKIIKNAAASGPENIVAKRDAKKSVEPVSIIGIKTQTSAGTDMIKLIIKSFILEYTSLIA